MIGGPAWVTDAPPGDPRIPVSVRTWPTARWMRRLLHESRADVVHAHWMPIAAIALLYGASPLVVSAWGSDVFRASRVQRIAWRLVVRFADVLMADSLALLGALEDLGAPPERCVALSTYHPGL